LHYKISEKSTKSQDIVKFLEELINSIKENKDLKDKYNNKKIFLYMDNAAVHRNKYVSKSLENTKLNVLFGIPYCPELNCSEYIFSILKKKFRSIITDDRYFNILLN
jgi:transposase